MATRGTNYRRQSFRRLGISTAEVAISTLLVALVSVTALHAVGGVFKSREVSKSVHARAALVQATLAEITQAQYEDDSATSVFGPEPGEFGFGSGTREGFDDVDDYHGWSESPPCPKGSSQPLPGYNGWSRSVRISRAVPTDPRSDAASDQGLKRIAVTVTDPTGRVTTHIAFRSRWGAVQQPGSSDMTVQTYVGNELNIIGNIELISGTNLTNHAQD